MLHKLIQSPILKPDHANWRRRFKKQVFAIDLFGVEVIDRQTIQTIFEDYKRETPDDKLNRVFFVIIDQSLSDSAWIEIAAIRADEKIQIIPIDDILIQKSLQEGRIRTNLDTHLKRFLGKERNLYNRKDPVSDRLNFFGREVLANNILENMTEGQAVGLFGIRKMGKTSLLNFLSSQQTSLAYIDLERAGSLVNLYQHILSSWERHLRVRYRVSSWKPPKLSTEPDPSAVFADALRELENKVDLPHGIGVLLDEIELIVPRKNSTDLEITDYLKFARTLRSLVQEGSLSLTVAGVDTPQMRASRIGIEQNPFHDFFQEIYLEPLHRADCIQMIRNIGRQMVIAYEPGAAEFATEISGDHPFLARQLCGEAFEALDLSRTNVVTAKHLREAASNFISNPKTAKSLNAYGLWGEMLNESLWGE
jgi:hypothetical protein